MKLSKRYTLLIISLIFSNTLLSQIYWDTSFNLQVYDHYRYKFVAISNNKILAGTNYGIYFSNDNGKYWQKDYNSFSQSIIVDVIQDQSGNLYLTTTSQAFVYKVSDGEWHNIVPNLNSGFSGLAIDSRNDLYLWSGGLYKTTNMGSNWLPINKVTSETFYKIHIDKNDNIYIATAEGLFFSNNFGVSFSKIFNGDVRFILSTNNSSLLISTTLNKVLYRSNDNGQSWNTIKVGSDRKINTIYQLPDGSILSGSDEGVFYSSDDGLSWSAVGGISSQYSITDIGYNNGYVFVGCYNRGILRGNYNIVALLNPPLLVSPSDQSINVSINPTLTWSQVNSAISYSIQISTDPSFYPIVFFSQSGITTTSKQIEGLFSYNTKYYWRVNATDGNSTSSWSDVWSFTTQSLSSTNWQITNWTSQNLGIQAITSNNQNHIFVCTSTDGIYRSTDLGNSWRKIINGLTPSNITSISIDELGRIFIGTHGSGVYYSTNNGDSWNKTNLSANYINKVYALNNYIFAGDGYGCSGVYRSTDMGLSWTNVKSGLGVCTGNVIIMKNGFVFGGSGIEGMYKSTNYGNSWTQINNGLTSTNISTMAYDNFSNIYVGTQTNTYTGMPGRGVFKSSDYGATWVNLTNGITTNEISQLSASGNGIIFTSGTGNKAIFRSTNYGNSWSQYSNGFPDHSDIGPICVTNSGYVFAAVNNIIYKIFDPLTELYEKSDSLPVEFILYQNYPNPFNPSTTIYFSLPQYQFVTLKIYDILGREISTLINEEKQPGNYKETFDGSNLSSGVYYYQMKAGKFVETKKLILLK